MQATESPSCWESSTSGPRPENHRRLHCRSWAAKRKLTNCYRSWRLSMNCSASLSTVRFEERSFISLSLPGVTHSFWYEKAPISEVQGPAGQRTMCTVNRMPSTTKDSHDFVYYRFTSSNFLHENRSSIDIYSPGPSSSTTRRSDCETFRLTSSM